MPVQASAVGAAALRLWGGDGGEPPPDHLGLYAAAALCAAYVAKSKYDGGRKEKKRQ